MKLSTSLCAVGALYLASAASAQVMTEFRNNTSGLDWEFVEILGTPGQSTDGLMILVVEGDPAGSTGGPGTLDQAYDLSGNFFGAGDEYFVFGSVEGQAGYGPGVVDLTAGDNMFENSTLTLYLVNVPDPLLRDDILSVWEGTDISDPIGSTTTRIATDPNVTILDAIALWDGDTGDIMFDGVPELGGIGPNGFPASGVLRDGGCPGEWCTDAFVEFSTTTPATPPYYDATPGMQNPMTSCATEPSLGSCGPGGGLGTPYCMAALNSTGATGALTAMGSAVVADNDVTLTAASLPATSFGFFIVSRDQGFVMMPGGSSGNLCLSGNVGRYVGAGQIQNSGPGGTFSLTLDLTAIPQPAGSVAAASGDTWNFQTWFRDSDMGTPTSNFTQGLEIIFQ